MLFNPKSKSTKKLFYFFVLPISFPLVWIFAIQVVYAQNENILNPKPNININSPALLNNVGLLQKIAYKKVSLIKPDSVKSQTAKMKLISFESMDGNNGGEVIYLKGAVIEINNGLLTAKDVEWNQLNSVLIAKGATFKTDDKFVEAEKLIFNVKNGNYNLDENSDNYFHKELEKTENKINYKAIDSVRLSKGKLIVDLYGDAEFNYGRLTLKGSQIRYNKQSNTAIAKQASFYREPNNLEAKADSIFVNFNTAEIQVFGGQK